MANDPLDRFMDGLESFVRGKALKAWYALTVAVLAVLSLWLGDTPLLRVLFLTISALFLTAIWLAVWVFNLTRKLGASTHGPVRQIDGLRLAELTDAVSRQTRMLINRMEAEKQKCDNHSGPRAVMENTQADLEGVDGDLKRISNALNGPIPITEHFGIPWSGTTPTCKFCFNALSAHDQASLRCYTCNRDFRPNDKGHPITVPKALVMMGGEIRG